MADRTLTEFLRAEYHNPTHGDCHLRVSGATQTALRASLAPRPPRPEWQPASYAEMVGTPVVIDDAVPLGRWRLVRNADPDEVVECGDAIPPAQDERPGRASDGD